MTVFEPPKDPKLNDAWVDDAGDLYTWNGTEWVPFQDMPYFPPNSAIRES